MDGVEQAEEVPMMVAATTPQMSFVAKIGTHEKFIRQWEVATSTGWGEGVTLRHVKLERGEDGADTDASQILCTDQYAIPPAAPSLSLVIRVQYSRSFAENQVLRLHDADGSPFGEELHAFANIPSAQLENLPEYIANLTSDSEPYKLSGARAIRKLLADPDGAPIRQVIDAGALPLLVECIGQAFNSHPKLQFEAAWALTNIASGDSQSTNLVAEASLDRVVGLLHSTSNEVVDQAVWCLGNVAGDGGPLRDAVHSVPGCMDRLLELLHTPNQTVSMLRNTTWTLSNLCRGEPKPKAAFITDEVVRTLIELGYHADAAVAADATWGLRYLASDPVHSEALIRNGVVAGLAARVCSSDYTADRNYVCSASVMALGLLEIGRAHV